MGCGLGFLWCAVWFSPVAFGFLFWWIFALGTYSLLLGSIGLKAFWTLSLKLSLDFIFFYVLFSFLSTQGTFNGDGHLFLCF